MREAPADLPGMRINTRPRRRIVRCVRSRNGRDQVKIDFRVEVGVTNPHKYPPFMNLRRLLPIVGRKPCGADYLQLRGIPTVRARPLSPRQLQRVGGMMRALPVRPRSSCTSANRKLTFTKANIWSAKPLSPLANPVFPLRRAITRFFRKMQATFRPCSAIMWMITATSLGQISTHERIPVRKERISMARECHMRCSSEAVTRCIRAMSHPLPRRMVASVCQGQMAVRFFENAPVGTPVTVTE